MPTDTRAALAKRLEGIADEVGQMDGWADRAADIGEAADLLARAARLEEAHAVLAAFARTAPGCLPERVQRAVDLAPWDGALYRALLNPEGGDR